MRWEWQGLRDGMNEVMKSFLGLKKELLLDS